MRPITRKLLSNTIVTAVVAAVLLLFTSLGSPSLNIDLSLDKAGLSQVFFNDAGSYSEKNSEIFPVQQAQGRLSFSLKGSKSPLRWDPAQGATTITAAHPYFTILGLKIAGGQIAVSALNQIQSIEEVSGKMRIATLPDANDPQLKLSFDEASVNRAKMHFIGILCLLAAACAAVLTLASQRHSYFAQRATNLKQRIHQHLIQSKFGINEFLILFLIAAFINVYFIANLSLSIDDEMGAARENAEVWISQGRWAVYLIERFIFPQPALPFAPYLLLATCLAASYMMLIRSHGHIPTWKTYLIYPVLCGYPTWWLISEFSSNVPGVAIGCLLTCFSAYLAFIGDLPDEEQYRRSKLRVVTIPLLLAFAIACYQSLIILYVCICLGITLTKLLSDRSNWRHAALLLFKNGLTTVTYVVAGAIFYFVINKIAQNLANSYSPYLSNFVKIDNLLRFPIETIAAIAAEAKKMYTGDASRFGAAIPAMNGLLVLSLLSIVTYGRSRCVPALFTFTLLLAAPFLLHFIAGAENVPLRTLIALSYVTWIMALVILSSQNLIILACALVIMPLYQLQTLGVTSQYIASAKLTQDHDHALASDIYLRLKELASQGATDKPVVIDIYGHKPFHTRYATAWTSTTQASFFDWDNGNQLRMVTYMKLLGLDDIESADESTRHAMTPRFLQMPVWPAPGSVAEFDGVYLVKLSSDADPIHQLAK